jgi:hypothetical protein
LKNTSKDEMRQILPTGDLESWSARYTGAADQFTFRRGGWTIDAVTVIDNWSQQAVRLQAATAADPNSAASEAAVESETALHTRFLERAKLLRSCDHAHIEPLIDYFVDLGERRWVTPALRAIPLSDRLQQTTPPPVRAVVQLIIQFVSVVSYFEMLPPHVVPTLAGSSCLTVDEEWNLYVSGYQSQYLLGDSGGNPFIEIAEFICQICNHLQEEAIRIPLLETALELTAPKPPAHLSSLTKVRNTIKHIEEKCSI